MTPPPPSTVPTTRAAFDARLEQLTPKQRVVLKHFLQGRSDREIAAELVVTEAAVRKHMSNLCRLFGLHNEAGETYSYRADLIDLFIQFQVEAVAPALQSQHTYGPRPLAVPPATAVAPLYLERPPIEAQCALTLGQPGALVRIRGTHLMGKTSLACRLITQCTTQGYRTVLINCRMASRVDCQDLDRFLRWFCLSIGQALGLANRLEEYWDLDFSTSMANCQEYFAHYLLPATPAPLLLCLDEVERLFPYEATAAQFLGMLRSWHEQAKIQSLWQQLRLVLIHATEVYVKLDVNASPFNVGLPIELPEFTPTQVQQLAQHYGRPLSRAQVQDVLTMLGGHPYRLEQLFQQWQLQPMTPLAALLAQAPTPAGIYSGYLEKLWQTVMASTALRTAVEVLLHRPQPVELPDTVARQLHCLGLVTLQGYTVRWRCQLHRDYFAAQWRAQPPEARV